MTKLFAVLISSLRLFQSRLPLNFNEFVPNLSDQAGGSSQSILVHSCSPKMQRDCQIAQYTHGSNIKEIELGTTCHLILHQLRRKTQSILGTIQLLKILMCT